MPELIFLFVRESERRRSIGNQLVQATTKKFKEMGVKKYRLGISIKNIRGHKFYESKNFIRKTKYKFIGKLWYVYEYDIK